MTSPFTDLIVAFTRRKGIELAPDWAVNVPADLSLDDSGALDALAAALEWKVAPVGKPRAHDFPLLGRHAVHGWGIAEQWIDGEHIRLLTASGMVEAPFDDTLELFAPDVPAGVRLPARERAIDLFWSAILRRKSMLVDATVATIVVNLISLVTSIYSMQVYDRVIPRSGMSTLAVLTGGMVFALILDLMLRNTRAMMIDREAGHIDSEVSEYFFARMQAVRLDARPKSIGTMAAQLRGTDQIRSLLSSASLFVLADLPFALLFIVVMWTLGGIVSLVPLIAFPLSLLLAWLMGRFIKADTNAAQVSGNRKNGLLVESLDAAETVKATMGSWHMLAAWNRLIDQVHHSDLNVKRWSTLAGSGFSALQQLAYVGVVCLGAYEVTEGHMTMGAVVACSILSGRVSGPIVSALPNLVVQWGFSRSSLAALDNILAMPSDAPLDRQMVRYQHAVGSLKIEGVKFVHQGTKVGVAASRAVITPGERIALIGPVGSGKSTLLRLMAGLFAAQEGHVTLDGVDVRQMAENDLRRHICYLPQDYRLINGTLRDNLTLGLSDPGDEKLLAAAQATGLSQLIQSHPQGLDLQISEGGMGLSGGQRTLVGLTRLLLVDAKILLLDEPTANLDQDTETRVLGALVQSLRPDVSLVFVTHKLQLLNLVQRLMVVANGQLAVDGPVKDVLAQLQARPAAAAAQPSGAPSPTSSQTPAQTPVQTIQASS
ncbi:MAG: hypothetical protein RLZZ08_1134 [Pseudomonadota bacterium]|jgi:ATP-binding cassette subfamily C protein LapB